MTVDTVAGGAAERVTPVAVLAAVPDGQAALFEDPRRLLALEPAELRQLGAEVAQESGSVLARVRRANGLVAWAMWYQSTELAYADWERAHAEDLRVPPTTLRRWRRDVVDAESLPVPAVGVLRSEAAKKAVAVRKTAGQTPGAIQSVKTLSTGPAAPVNPPARLPDPGPPPSTRAAIAHLIDHLHALDPHEAGAAMTPSQLDLVLDWAEHCAKAAPRRRQAARKPRQPGEGQPTKSDCPHPITRQARGGGFCYECGETIKK